MGEKKVITMENLENEGENNEDVFEEEVIEKEPLLNKAKRFVKDNRKKILAAGAILVTGAIGFALGIRSDSDDEDDIVDSTCEEVEGDDSDSTEETEE
mgnify:CR=1 FL=1